MNETEQFMRAANPVADSHASLNDDEFDALLLLTQVRSGTMNMKELTTPVEPEKSKYSGWMIAVAAAIIVIVLGAATLLLSPEDGLEPTAPSTTTSLDAAPSTTLAAPSVSSEQTATIASFEAAWNDGNEEALRALLTADASLEYDASQFGLDNNQLMDWALSRRAMDVVASIGDCVPADETVKCSAEFDGPVIIALALAPLRDVYTFTFEGDLIAHIHTLCQICGDNGHEFTMGQWARTQASGTPPPLIHSYTDVRTPEEAAWYLEWAVRWHDAGRP